MGWATLVKALLILLVFSKWPPTTDTLLQESSLVGMPLSEAEYETFYQTLATRKIFRAICLRRAILGCYDPAVQALDQYENHGVIPDGWICSDFPDNASFPGFCDFALYRCIVRKYFAKRVPCPEETMQKSTVAQANQEGVHDDIEISTTDRSFKLLDSTPAISTELSPEHLATEETAAMEILTIPLPSSGIPDDMEVSTADRSFEPPENTPTTNAELSPEPLATKETAVMEILTIPLPSNGIPDDMEVSTADRSFEPPENTPTTNAELSPGPLATEETAVMEILTTSLPSRGSKTSLLELLSSSAIETASKLISHILAAFTGATKPSNESTTAEPLMELTPTSPDTATPESSSELTMTTTNEFLIELTSTAAIVTESELNLATMAPIEAPAEAITALSFPELVTESFPELATAVELIQESTSDTTETYTVATTTESDTEPCIVDYPEPLSDSTESTSPTDTVATSILPIHTATSSTTTASPQPFVPGFDAPLPLPPPQANSTMRILILSFIRNKEVKNGDIARINTLTQTALGSGNILLQDEVQNPLPANGLKDLFVRLQDKRVQQLLPKMQSGISGGGQKPQLLSHALQLLSALNPRSDSKNRLQR